MCFINKPSTHVIITKYCPDITICISRAITYMALCNPRQRDGWRYVTPWELVGLGGISYIGASNLLSLNNHTQSPKPLIKTVEITRLIGSGDISYKGASNPLSLNNHTQSPKSLIKSVEIFPKIHLLLLVDHTQSVKPLHVSNGKNNEDTFNLD